ncbi:MAG: polyprenyl synthetase family protein [Gemmatales bacterium]|nr:polyprenyl synthetase family protein [Gemmatales bacterium]MDW8388284.1 polyprenyl synthetase family protein [Gemmatales bacterium]
MLETLKTPSPLTDFFGPIRDDLAAAERIFQQELTSEVPFIRELVAYLAHYRGKRLRPALLLLSARACGQVTPQHHVLAAVVEMIHTATLVHDDVLDEATMRRHVPTLHARWGNSASVLLGDLLFTHAFYLTSTTGSAEACRIIGEATNRVCAGELRQIGERGNLALSEDVYHEIIRGKTAELTACCCRLGAMFAGADEAVVHALERYGMELGIAFQIGDDLLDLVGTENKAGKSLGTDLEQRKLTLPVIRLLQTASAETSHQVRQLLTETGNHKRERLLPLLQSSDALNYAAAEAEQHAAAARDCLAILPETPYRTLLAELTRRVVRRQA